MNRSELTAARIHALADSLSDRDRAVLDTLTRTRLATGAQLQRLHFTDVGSRERRRVLSALVEKHLLYRLARVIGGNRAGSSGFVFALGTTGQRLRGLRNSNGRPRARPGSCCDLTHTSSLGSTGIATTGSLRSNSRRSRLRLSTANARCIAVTGPAGGGPRQTMSSRLCSSRSRVSSAKASLSMSLVGSPLSLGRCSPSAF